MKIRVANKIVDAVGTPDERRYTGAQIDRAVRRVLYACRTGPPLPAGTTAQILAGIGHPGEAFALLMRTPEREW